MLAPEIARRGRSYFVWKYGVLCYGMPTAVIGTALYFPHRYGLEPSAANAGGFIIHLALSLLLVGLLGGYVWGSLLWALARRWG